MGGLLCGRLIPFHNLSPPRESRREGTPGSKISPHRTSCSSVRPTPL